MKKNKSIIWIIVAITFVIVISLWFIIPKDKNNSNNNEVDYEESENEPNLEESNEIPDDYIAVFNGGAGEITYSTYIYKIDNGHDKYGFKYINTTNTTKSWGSSEWETKITKRGEFDLATEAFNIAYENGAYSYVLVPNDEKAYSIEEFEINFVTD